jgi:hydroxyacylglutathione hydrolase
VSKFLILSFLFFAAINQNDPFVTLPDVHWIHGSADCSKNADVPIQIVQYNPNTWIFRQNKCVNYEAPFMFLFLGDKKALLMDTGATPDENTFPIYTTVHQIIQNWSKENNKTVELIVAHTHGHGDHWAGDGQFKGKPNTIVVGLEATDVQQFFELPDWPLKSNSFDLGNRKLEIIPIPGHQNASIALYDEQTQWLLTGDTFYPGRLYVKDWLAFKKSIQRLVDFTAQRSVSYVLGNHIEMSKEAGVDYKTGTTWQPKEHALPLTVNDLAILKRALDELGDQPARKVLNDFIIEPR